MQYPIYTEASACRLCNKCLNRCPVKALCVQDGPPDILSNRCIFCGKCVRSCPSRAKRVRSDVQAVQNLIGSGDPVYVSLAPSFPAEFYGCTPERLIAALKRLGFHAVSETAIGADLVTAATASDLEAAQPEHKTQKLVLSSACPAVVLYIKRYAPAFVPYLNDRASPLLAHAAFLRHRYGPKTRVVFIGPCIAKKREADQMKEIAAAITFDELRQWFDEAGIRLDDIPDDEAAAQRFVPRRAAKGAFFPVDGGMLVALRKYHGVSRTSNMVLSGINTIAETLNSDTLNADRLETPLFLELLACQGGCVNGPCITRDASAINRRAQLLQYAAAADDLLDAETAGAGAAISLDGTLTAQELPARKYAQAEINAALAEIGKYDKRDELDCSHCGYETCRAFAAALLDKRVDKTMCAAYTRNLAQRKANTLIQAMPAGVVIVDKNHKVVECNRKFAHLLGSDIEELYEIDPNLCGLNLNKVAGLGQYFEEAFNGGVKNGVDFEFRDGERIFNLNIFEIERGEILAGVLEDITKPQTRRDRTVARAQKIIDKNVQTVQKIAFLLGENAAEIEGILHSIIESYNAGGRKK